MILTFCGCSMVMSICIDVLMRVLMGGEIKTGLMG